MKPWDWRGFDQAPQRGGVATKAPWHSWVAAGKSRKWPVHLMASWGEMKRTSGGLVPPVQTNLTEAAPMKGLQEQATRCPRLAPWGIPPMQRASEDIEPHWPVQLVPTPSKKGCRQNLPIAAGWRQWGKSPTVNPSMARARFSGLKSSAVKTIGILIVLGLASFALNFLHWKHGGKFLINPPWGWVQALFGSFALAICGLAVLSFLRLAQVSFTGPACIILAIGQNLYSVWIRHAQRRRKASESWWVPGVPETESQRKDSAERLPGLARPR
jgi:hypothetical protein